MKAWFTSYERVLQFTTIPQEPPHELESDANLTHWPVTSMTHLLRVVFAREDTLVDCAEPPFEGLKGVSGVPPSVFFSSR